MQKTHNASSDKPLTLYSLDAVSLLASTLTRHELVSGEGGALVGD